MKRHKLWGLVLAVAALLGPALFFEFLPMAAPAHHFARPVGSRLLSDPDHPCAIISAVMASHLLGRPTTLAEAKRFIPLDAFQRASLSEVADGLAAMGFVAVGVELPPHSLSLLRIPAILHVDEAHFVVCRTAGNGQVVIYDPPRPPVLIDDNRLAGRWKGAALLVAPDRASMTESLARLRIEAY